MSTSMLMSLGTRAMTAAYAQLNSVGNNIANANTPGYSRQQTIQSTTEGQFTGAGFFGRGVTVQTVQRASNIFLTQQAAGARSSAAADSVRSEMLQQLEKVFGTGASGLGGSATQLFNAFADLAASPSDLSARQAVLARAEDLASTARSYSDQIGMVQANVRNDVSNSVSEVNTLAKQVAQLNTRISQALGTGHQPNDLLDSRDELIRQISDKIEVHTISAADGSMSVFVAGGQSLVLGSQSNQLVARPDNYDSSRTAVGISVSGQMTPLGSKDLGGGSLAGLLEFQDTDLVDARNRLGQLVAGLASAANTQQSFGIDLSGAQGTDLFKLGKSQALPASSNASAGGVPLATVTVQISDAKALKASEYTMEDDPNNAGAYLVTRLADVPPTVFTNVQPGDVIDGFSFSLGAPPPSPGDRFLLQPSSGVANGMAVALSNPRSVAAASPLTAVAALANKGTASVGSLMIVADKTAPYQPMTVHFTDGAGGYELLDAGGAQLATGNWSPQSPIAYNGFELRLEGQPALDDTFSIDLTAYPQGNNGNALAFDSLAERNLIDGQSVTDAYALLLSDVGVRVQGAMSAADTSSAVSTRASEALTSEVGVNLDEEAAKLIQFQQAYQAAAKMLQTAQTIMDTLLQLGR